MNDQPCREANRAAIVAYFESGIKQGPGRVGIELEHVLVRDDGSPVSYRGEDGVGALLEDMRERYPDEHRDVEGDLLGVSRPGAAITLEPACQLELSAGPFEKLEDARACFDDFEEYLAAAAGRRHMRVDRHGYHPSARADELGIIPKRRYEHMNAYLGKVSPFALCMMRGSASTQVSIDYTGVEDCLVKMRVASGLVPIFSLVCDNTPVFEGGPRAHELVRTEIWKHCDPDRCRLVPDVMDPGFDLGRYADYVLDTPAILVPDADEVWRADARTFGEIYADVPMTRADVEHALSMFFNDVRLKTYIEIRPADALPVPQAIAYAALVKGIFYSPAALEHFAARLADVRNADVEAAKDALMEQGWAAEVYGRSVGSWADELLSWASSGLSDDERPFLGPVARIVRSRETLATGEERAQGRDLYAERADKNEREGAGDAGGAAEAGKAGAGGEAGEATAFALKGEGGNGNGNGNGDVDGGGNAAGDGAEGLPDNEGRMVTIRYRGFFDDGSVFIDQSEPVSFPCVPGWMPPAILDAVRHMAPGQRKEIRVGAEEAYEESTEERIVRIPRERLPRDLETPVGGMVNLEDPTGQTYPARVVEVTEDEVVVDMNHAAVCRPLNFSIELLDVESLEAADAARGIFSDDGAAAPVATKGSTMSKNEGKTLRVHYVGTLDDGTKFDSSRDRGEPLEFVCLAGQMIPGFDAAVADMEPGETKTVTIPAAEAYGDYDETMTTSFPLDQVPDADKLKVGDELFLQNAVGQVVKVRVKEIGDDAVVFDLNHELAGKDLTFEIELVEVL